MKAPGNGIPPFITKMHSYRKTIHLADFI